MSNFGRKVKRKQKPDLGQATNQLAKAVGVLQNLEGLNTLADLRPLILETHELVTAAIEDISVLADEQMFQRRLINCLLRNEREHALTLIQARDEKDLLEELLPDVPELLAIPERPRENQ